MLTFLKLTLLLAAYLAIGVAFYTSMEEKDCESPERLTDPDYDASTCSEHWTVCGVRPLCAAACTIALHV